ncbi:hypothetical protein GZ176_11780 [Dermatophilus congolensis]|nr:hypothetical protein [Dermatophilus congolensis]MBO3148595.1 hypothetical protein [Dermatophilus congolensis]MBO3157599.1 hypothetical protein [Dermatophilus congolensis]MBO3159879.1 hypothetical protein [Dermatophilus congolensis]MBO3166618.1 hypothetical protein [Dermatophilus congolensis]
MSSSEAPGTEGIASTGTSEQPIADASTGSEASIGESVSEVPEQASADGLSSGGHVEAASVSNDSDFPGSVDAGQETPDSTAVPETIELGTSEPEQSMPGLVNSDTDMSSGASEMPAESVTSGDYAQAGPEDHSQAGPGASTGHDSSGAAAAAVSDAEITNVDPGNGFNIDSFGVFKEGVIKTAQFSQSVGDISTATVDSIRDDIDHRNQEEI